MKRIVFRGLVIGVVLLLLLVFTGTALASGYHPECYEDAFWGRCVHVYLTSPTMVGDYYVGGLLELSGANEAFWIFFFADDGDTATFEFRNIQEPSNPEFSSLYVYNDVSKKVTLPALGEWVDVPLTPTKKYVRGILELTCNIQNHAGENVSCAPSIDGVPQANIAAGQSAKYTVDPGSHTVVTALAGDPAQMLLWAPASLTQKVTTRVGATPKKVTAAFKKAGHLITNLDQAGVTGDWYLNGVQVGVQVAGIDKWVEPSKPQKLEVKNIVDPAAAGVYTWKDASQTTTVRSGETKTVTVKLKKVYLKGFLDLTCDIKNYAAEDVNCAVTIDGAPQGNVSAGQKVTYTLDPGNHTVDVALAGAQADLWSPATQSKVMRITATATPKKLAMTFKKDGHLIVNLDQPGVVGDFYVDGVLIASQAASIEQWVTPGTSHKVEVKNLVDPTGAQWQDASQTVTVLTAAEKTVTVKLKAK